jgi:hypothetical protein
VPLPQPSASGGILRNTTFVIFGRDQQSSCGIELPLSFVAACNSANCGRRYSMRAGGSRPQLPAGVQNSQLFCRSALARAPAQRTRTLSLLSCYSCCYVDVCEHRKE